MATMEVDPSKVANDGQQFNDMADLAYSIYSGLARAAAMIQFPDDDKISQMFSEQWNSLVNGTSSLLLAFRGNMTDVATNVGNTAALYSKSNDVNGELAGGVPATGETVGGAGAGTTVRR